MDLSDRGLRNPQHNFLHAHNERFLYPLFAAPVRPNETIVGCRFQADTMFSRMFKAPWFPGCEVEVAAWLMPISSLGDEFLDLFRNDFEDVAQLTSPNNEPLGTGVGVAALPIDQQGPNSSRPLQVRNRPWAGELGQQDGEVTLNPALAYAPYVSAATYHVADMFYERDSDASNQVRGDDDMWQTPPALGPHTRGATASMVGEAQGDDQIPISSLSEWAERLAILSKPNYTYAEYLESFGVDPSRVAGMPEPLFIQRRRVRRLGSPQVIGNVQFGSSVPAQKSDAGVDIQPVQGDWQMFSDTGGLSLMGQSWDITRKLRFHCNEPSILLGTLAYWFPDFGQRSFAQISDITRLVSSGMWGDANMSEQDFITLQAMVGASEARSESETTTKYGPGDDQRQERNLRAEGSPYVMNMLNLFLNGDTFSNDVGSFRLYGAGDLSEDVPTTQLSPQVQETGPIGRTNFRLNTTGSFRFGVATDMVRR